MRSSSILWSAALLAVLLMASPPAYGQGGGAATLSGVVQDTSKGVIPGADVVAKNAATGAEFRAVSDATGQFVIPALQPGTYTVSVSLMGFKTFVAPDVKMEAATPLVLTATLSVGTLEETVVVTGATEVVQTQSATVQQTLQVKQLQQLPLVTHTALDSILSLPGVDTPYGGTSRSSRVNGLGGAALNITLDGVNVQDNRSKSDGFFMYIRPMLDSVEEITVSTSTPGAESAGEGAAQVKMVTRSGSNRFSGAVYDTWRNQAGLSEDDILTRTKKQAWYWKLNTPYYFNTHTASAQPKTAAGDDYFNDARVTTPGMRIGGPVMKDKLFYFFNIERFVWPATINKTRYLMTRDAQQGLFKYVAKDGTQQQVNLLSIAASHGVPGSTLDPVMAKLLADIRSASGTEGVVNNYDLNTDRYQYVPAGDQTRLFPTVRMDYNISANHRVSGVFRYNQFRGAPDTLNNNESRWPGFPNYGGQDSDRWMWQASLRSTIGKNVVNQLNTGYIDAFGKGTGFSMNVTANDFACTGLGCQSVNGQPFNLGNIGFNNITAWSAIGGQSLTSATSTAAPNADVAPRYDLDDTVTWLKGKHTISLGGAYSRTFYRSWSQTVAKGVTFGIPSSQTAGVYTDPAYQWINAASPSPGDFPGGLPTGNYETWARNLFALLTGRVNSVAGNMILGADGTYRYNGELERKAYRDNLGFFVSDSWRVKPNLTLTAGLRYELQFPGVGLTENYSTPQSWQMIYGITGAGSGENSSSNLYLYPKPTTGTNPLLVKYDQSQKIYQTDWNNLAPSVGVAWRPSLSPSWLTKLLSTDPVFRGGYSMSFIKYGIELWNATATNSGGSRSAARTETSGTPFLGAESGKPVWPVLLSQPDRLAGSALVPEGSSPTYPFTPAVNEAIRAWDPSWGVPYTHQYSFGFQRELGKSMALEIRYNGNTQVGGWQTWNFQSTDNWNLLENGYFNEFKLAQQNLRANIQAGRGGTGSCPGCTFAYYGPGTGTAPLPIFMAYLKGIPLANTSATGGNQDPAQYAAVSQFSNSTWYNRLSQYDPSVDGMLGTSSSGLNYGIGTGAAGTYDVNRIAAGLPVNFFMPNPALPGSTGTNGTAYLDRTTGNTRYNAITIDLRRRMSAGFLVQGNYTYGFLRTTYAQNSLREAWYSVEATGSGTGATPIHSIKANWVYELPFGQGKKWGGGVGRWMEMLVGGWEIDGIVRLQSGARYNFGGVKLVGFNEKEMQEMFKFYHRPDAAGKDAIYMWPEDIVTNSILAFNERTATTASGYNVGKAPSGRYFAPASSASCVQYVMTKDMFCPGTTQTRVLNGPWFFKTDLNFVKRIAVHKNMRVEVRMDLFNVFDTVNLLPNTTTSSSSVTGWQVTSAATDLSASQDPGGRITQFGLRFSW